MVHHAGCVSKPTSGPVFRQSAPLLVTEDFRMT